MDRIEALQTLRSLERMVSWALEEGNENDEGICLLAINLKNSFAALAIVLGFIDHEHTCPTCETNFLEGIYDEQS